MDAAGNVPIEAPAVPPEVVEDNISHVVFAGRRLDEWLRIEGTL